MRANVNARNWTAADRRERIETNEEVGAANQRHGNGPTYAENMEALHRYDSVDLSHPPKREPMGRSLLFEIVEMVLEFPVAVGKALLVTAWTIWQTRIPRIIKIFLVGILA